MAEIFQTHFLLLSCILHRRTMPAAMPCELWAVRPILQYRTTLKSYEQSCRNTLADYLTAPLSYTAGSWALLLEYAVF